jgi:uncharacterized membrane protein YfcA
MLEQVLLVSLIVFAGGLLKGFAGFGYAVLSIGLLSFMFNPSDAVILMIIPLISGNLVLVNEINTRDLESYVGSFLPFMAAVALGSIVGVFVIGAVPGQIFSSAIGVFLLLYSIGRSGIADYHLGRLKSKCFRKGAVFQIFSGSIAGFIFGSMSIGALTVSYLESIELERKVFIGLLSFVLFVISGIRIGLCWVLGYYSGNNLLYLSFLAGFPGLLGVFLGSKVREGDRNNLYSWVVLLLFGLIGLRLIIG